MSGRSQQTKKKPSRNVGGRLRQYLTQKPSDLLSQMLLRDPVRRKDWEWFSGFREMELIGAPEKKSFSRVVGKTMIGEND